MVNVSNSTSEFAQFFIGEGGIGTSADDLGNTVFAGVGGAVSKELKAITGSNLLTVDELLTVIEKLVTSEGKRGQPEGVDGVNVEAITDTSITLSFEGINGAVDNVTFNFDAGFLDGEIGGGQNAGDAKSTYAVIEDGEAIIGTAFLRKQADGQYHVGGSLKGEADTIKILQAALDDEAGAVQLVNVDSDSFTITISRGNATDTYTFVGDNAQAALDSVGGDLINPGNIADQFVFLDSNASGTVGIGFANRYEGAFGGSLSVEELVSFIQSGEELDGVTVTDLGGATQVEFAGNNGTVDTVIVDDSFFLA